jgi:hypothetical protein
VAVPKTYFIVAVIIGLVVLPLDSLIMTAGAQNSSQTSNSNLSLSGSSTNASSTMLIAVKQALEACAKASEEAKTFATNAQIAPSATNDVNAQIALEHYQEACSKASEAVKTFEEIGKIISGTSVTTNFTYSNQEPGFTIQYPSTWNKTEGQQSVSFISPNKTALIVRFETLPVNNPPLAIVSNVNLNYLRERFDVIASAPTIAGTIPAYGAVYLDNNGNKFMQIWSIVGNMQYRFQYVNTVGDYDKDLPTINAMIQSFRLS